MSLKLDWCSSEAIKYACSQWHYSKCVPAGKATKIGIWEEGIYIGCIVFSLGTNRYIGMPYGLHSTEVCELTRIAMDRHKTPVSKIISIGTKMCSRHSPGLKLIVSYADPRHSHLGIVYQASNWVYCGTNENHPLRSPAYKAPGGKIVQWRSMAEIIKKNGARYTRAGAASLGYEPLRFIPKHKYLYPLTPEMRELAETLRKPYPKTMPQ